MAAVNRHFSVALLLFFFGPLIVAQAAPKPSDSEIPQKRPLQPRRWSCRTGLSLTAAVSTPRRDGVSDTEIRLTSPSKRQQGAEVNRERVPNSRYEIVAEIPEHPETSTERAVEVCDAEQGEYTLNLYESGDKPYRMFVRAGNENNDVALPEKLQAQEGRIRTFRFRMELQKGEVHLTWLDSKGKPHLNAVEFSEW